MFGGILWLTTNTLLLKIVSLLRPSSLWAHHSVRSPLLWTRRQAPFPKRSGGILRLKRPAVSASTSIPAKRDIPVLSPSSALHATAGGITGFAEAAACATGSVLTLLQSHVQNLLSRLMYATDALIPLPDAPYPYTVA